MENIEYKGWNGIMVLTETWVIIKRGIRGFFFGGGMLRGDKTIPFSSIVAVQFKKSGLTMGYLQFTLKGWSEAKSGLFESIKDENSITFQNWGNNKFEELKTIIEKRIDGNSQKVPSSLDEIEKLAELKEKWILTQEEFDAKKKLLLGL